MTTSSYFSRAIARATGASRVRPTTSLPFARVPSFEPDAAAAGLTDMLESEASAGPSITPSGTAPRGRPADTDGAPSSALGRREGDVAPLQDGRLGGALADSRRAGPEMSKPQESAAAAGRESVDGTSVDRDEARRMPVRDARATPPSAAGGPTSESGQGYLLMPAHPRPFQAGATSGAREWTRDAWTSPREGRRTLADRQPRADRHPGADGDVHITIGRLEVTAVREPAPPRRTSPASPGTPAMSLEDYLARRRGRA